MNENIEMLEMVLKSVGTVQEKVDLMLNISALLIEQNENNHALKYLSEIQSFVKEETSTKSLLAQVYYQFSKAYRQKDDFEKALSFHEKFYGIMESIYQEKLSEQVHYEDWQREITGRKRTEKILHALEKAIGTIKLGVTITDTEGKIIYTNFAEAEMHGYTVGELMGQPAQIFSTPNQHRRLTVSDLKEIENWKRETVNKRKDGSLFPVQLVSNVIKDSEENPIGFITICEDITERKQSEAELQQKNIELEQALIHLEELNHEKNELLSIVAHDLKNPLSVVRGTAEILHQFVEVLDPKELVEHAQNIESSANRMFDLIQNLLDLNALELGKRNLSFKYFDLRVPLLTVVGDYVQHTKRKNIQMITQKMEKPYFVYGDESAAIQILDNLISNAIKYSPFDKKIYVRVMQDEDYIQCEIEDEGPGISSEDQQKLFHKFAKLSTKPTGGEHSTGLGLSIVKKLVEFMMGEVWCESEVGKGSIFFVLFPTKES